MHRIVIVVLAVFLLVPALGCPEEKGPMEKAGEAIDESVDKLTHPNEGALEKAGRKTDEAIDEAQKKLSGDD